MNDLLVLRDKIDIIDTELLTLLERRIALMKEVGEVKNKLNRPIRDYQREKEKLERLFTQTELPHEIVEKIWTVFFEGSEEIEKHE